MEPTAERGSTSRPLRGEGGSRAGEEGAAGGSGF